MNEKKNHLWLTTSYASDTKSLKVETRNKKSREKDLKENAIWYEDNEEERGKAYDLLIAVKKTIKKIYVDTQGYGKRAEWLTNEWVNKKDI
ncbi:MAG: hypothetical protein J6Y40_03085 [Bacteroidales bacterium]|nr:hypothetical protein [Bacteroidales bacterium]